MGTGSRKEIHRRITPGSATLEEILAAVAELQGRFPDREVFFDGDEYAVCSRPRSTATPLP